MVILGLDPGSRHTGYGVIEVSGGTMRPVAHGRFSPSGKAPLADRLASLARQLEELILACDPRAVALESPFHGLNARSLVVLAQARGALLAVLGQRGVQVVEYTPAEVKSAVAGHGRAEKDQVARMVRMLIPALADEPLSRDASDALAVAICCAHRLRHDRMSGRL